MKKGIVCHDDLDGVFSSDLVNILEGGNCEVFPVTSNNMDKTVLKLSNSSLYKKVIILDFGVSIELAEKLDGINRKGYKEIELIDHHQNNKFLNNYSWAYVKDSLKGVKQCTLSNVPKYYLIKGKLSNKEYESIINKGNYLGNLIEQVRKYDTFDYNLNKVDVDFYKDISFKINDLFEYGEIYSEFYVRKLYEKRYLKIKRCEDLISNQQYKISNYINNEREREYKRLPKLKIVDITINNKIYKVGCINNPKVDYTILGHKLLLENKNLNSIIMYNRKNGSIRSLDGSANDIAKYFGGDGHMNASGFKKKNKNWKSLEDKLYSI